MIEPRIVEQSKQSVCGASLRIGRTVNHSRHAGQDDRARAHRTWFEGYVERASLKPPVVQRLSRLRDRNHFGMSRRISQLLAAIVSRGNHTLRAIGRIIV